MKYLKTLNEHSNSSYKEIEFVCHNSDIKDSSDINDQRKLFKDLKELERESDYKIHPYMQDFCDDNHKEFSLAVIILDKENEDYWEKEIRKLGEKNNIEFDLYNDRNEYQVNSIIKGDYYDNLINEGLSRYDKYKLLIQNKPIVVYRGIHESGKNFHKGDRKLPFTYYSLTKEKADRYGKVVEYIFNHKSVPIKVFKGKDLFDKFGLDSNIEDIEVINTLIDEGYSAALIKGDELVVFDDSLVSEIHHIDR